MYYEFTVPGKPVPKGRPRFSGGRVFTPQQTHDAEQNIRNCFFKQFGRNQSLQGKWLLYCEFYFDTPKNRIESIKENKQNKWHSTKPDLDNLLKLVMDAFNYYILDDSNFVAAFGTKKYSDNARTVIRLYSLSDANIYELINDITENNL